MYRSGGSCHSDWKDGKGSRKHLSFIGQDKICASFHGAQPFSSNKQLVYTKKQWISLVLAHSSASEPVLFIPSLFVSWLSVCCFEISVYPEMIRMYCFALVKIPVLTKLFVCFWSFVRTMAVNCFIFKHSGTCHESSNHKVYTKHIYYTTSKCLTIWHSGPCCN